MRPLADMQAEVLDRMPRLEPGEASFDDAVGAVLAEDVIAPEDLPGFENAAMDGFAVVASDVDQPPVELEIIDDVAAGSVERIEVRLEREE